MDKRERYGNEAEHTWFPWMAHERVAIAKVTHPNSFKTLYWAPIIEAVGQERYYYFTVGQQVSPSAVIEKSFGVDLRGFRRVRQTQNWWRESHFFVLPHSLVCAPNLNANCSDINMPRVIWSWSTVLSWELPEGLKPRASCLDLMHMVLIPLPNTANQWNFARDTLRYHINKAIWSFGNRSIISKDIFPWPTSETIFHTGYMVKWPQSHT